MIMRGRTQIFNVIKNFWLKEAPYRSEISPHKILGAAQHTIDNYERELWEL